MKRATIAGGPYNTIQSGITDLLTYTDLPAAAGTYFYVVTAQTIAGESALSNEVKVITAQQLLAHLTFDEGSGVTAADSSGNRRNGTLNGATWAAGHSGNAVSLNGSGAYVALPDDLLVDVSDFTPRQLGVLERRANVGTPVRLRHGLPPLHDVHAARAVAQRLGRHALRHDGQRPR